MGSESLLTLASGFLTLTILELVLGIDNIIFIAIVAQRLEEPQRSRARRIGLALAVIMRLAMLAGLVWLIGLTQPIVTIDTFELSWRDLILAGGGLFLIAKATIEIHHEVEGKEHAPTAAAVKMAFGAVVTQIVLLDLVFSLDSIFTAIGMVKNLWLMASAIIVAVGVMMFAAAPVADFVHRHPTVKMLALAFLVMIGMALIADGMHADVPKGYMYAAVAFAVLVEGLNLWRQRRRG